MKEKRKEKRKKRTDVNLLSYDFYALICVGKNLVTSERKTSRRENEHIDDIY
jgi:hypothetical protein